MTLKEITDAIVAANKKNDALLALAADRDFTDEEVAQAEQISAEIARLESEKVAAERRANIKANAQKIATDASKPNQRQTLAMTPLATKPEIKIEHDWDHEFTGFGEFLKHVYEADRPGGYVSQKMATYRNGISAALTTYGNEASGADGGTLVPTEVSMTIKNLMDSLSEPSFLDLCDNTPVAGNAMTFPRDEWTPQGTSGVRAYWTGEAAATTQTKDAFATNTLRLNKLMALCPVTDELLADTSALQAYITKKAAEHIKYKVNLSIIDGTGAGQPLGIRTSSGISSIAKEGSQVADTINAANVTKMHGALLGGADASTRWLINHDAYNQLPQMTIGDMPVWQPPRAINEAPDGLLLGIPVIKTQLCQTLGDQGDIILCKFSQYKAITKAAGIEAAMSMHVYFENGATAFRFTFRVDGRPCFNTTVTPDNSTVTLAHFVQLDARA